MNSIKILYGPYNIRDVWSHRSRRLFNLRGLLNTLGFYVTLEAIQPRNRLIITLNGFEIYRCSLSLILYYYNTHEEILKKIIWAALEARARFSVAKETKFIKEKSCFCCKAKYCACNAINIIK